MFWSETLSIVQGIVVSCAAITGSIVAVRGLSTWKKQTKGHADYELARRILISLFRLRDAIDAVRHPMMWAHEIPLPPEDQAANMEQNKIDHYGRTQAYQARWDRVQKERTNLYADLLESEALWGLELKTLFGDISSLQHELWLCVHRYLEISDPDTDAETRKALRDIKNSERNILYDNLSESGDDFKNEMHAAIERIEAYLKPKLIR